MLKSIPNKIRTRIEVDYDRNTLDMIQAQFNRIGGATDKFQNRMDSIANSIRSFGTVLEIK